MKRASYRAGIEHIALNDDPTELEQGAVEATLTVGLLSELFGVSVTKVAYDVIVYRNKHAQRGG